MSYKATRLAIATACLGMLLATPVSAQPPVGSTFQDKEPFSEHHRRIYQLMEDMTHAMNVMAAQMAHDDLHGDLTPDQRRQMAERMGVMSRMMNRLSGLEARPAIAHGNLQKELDEMRKQMDEMTSASSMRPATK